MLGDSQLNVYILGSGLTPHQRERLQAQVQTALRALPSWSLELLRRRVQLLGVPNLPLIVEPRAPADASRQVIGFGQVESRPAVRLMPRLDGDSVNWGQDARYLVAKAVAYLAAPAAEDTGFWTRWAQAVADDGLKATAQAEGEHWAEATDLDLLLEMFAAYALSREHVRWSEMPAVKAFLEIWRAEATPP